MWLCSPLCCGVRPKYVFGYAGGVFLFRVHSFYVGIWADFAPSVAVGAELAERIQVFVERQ